VLQSDVFHSGFHGIVVLTADGKTICAFRKTGAAVQPLKHTCWCCDTVSPLYWRNVHAADATNNVRRVELRSAPLRHMHEHCVALMEKHFICSSLLVQPLLVAFHCPCIVRCSAFLPCIVRMGWAVVVKSTMSAACMRYTFTASFAIMHVGVAADLHGSIFLLFRTYAKAWIKAAPVFVLRDDIV
jgi:hypothetical protein